MVDVALSHPFAVDMLAAMHRAKRFRLATGVGFQGFAHLNGDPEALVDELLRLARLGAALEAAHDQSPRVTAGSLYRRALAPTPPKGA